MNPSTYRQRSAARERRVRIIAAALLLTLTVWAACIAAALGSH